MNVQQYLTSFGLTEMQSAIFLKLYELGSQPASVIARHIGHERTSTYKMMNTMVKQGFLRKTKKHGTTYFFANELSVIHDRVREQKYTADMLDRDFDDFAQEVKKLASKQGSFAPKMTLYDGTQGIKNLCNDIYKDITDHGYRVVKCFSSNTFDSYAYTSQRLGEYYQDFWHQLQHDNITVQTRTGEGIQLMESINTSGNFGDLLDVPAGNNTINIFVVGKSVYTVVFEDYPSGIRIQSKALANTMHFLFEQLGEKQ